jgi:molybdopterin-containing oxidoreductase family membrane subunit
VILYNPVTGTSRAWIAIASILVILGGLAQMYVIIIGGQAYPLVLFPGMDVSSSFADGIIAAYTPSLPEILLGLGGMGVALIIVALAIKVLRFAPDSLADADVDPHYSVGKAA